MKRRIGPGMFILLLMTSVLVDAIQLGLDFFGVGVVVNVVIDLFVAWIYWLWFKMLGVKFNNKGVLGSFIGGVILDFVPFMSAFAWTLDVIGVYFSVKIEDIAKNKATTSVALQASNAQINNWKQERSQIVG